MVDQNRGALRARALNRGDEAWKAEANCRKQVFVYAGYQGWDYERAQFHVTSLYYAAYDDVKPGREPDVGWTDVDDPFFLPRLWCSTCPVAAECVNEAVATGDIGGFRAGFTPKQLRRVIKIRRRERIGEEMGVQRLIVSSGRRSAE